MTGDLVIGADGVNSAVRRSLYPKSDAVFGGYVAWRGICSVSVSDLSDPFREYWGCERRFGFLPLKENLTYWYATGNLGEDVSIADDKESLQSMFDGWDDVVHELIRSTSTILRNPVYDIVPLKEWGFGNVVLLGDAAHAVSPNLGQGACQAIEDVVLFSQLVEGQEVSVARSELVKARYGVVRDVWRRSRQIGRLGQVDNKFLCRLRDLLVRLTPSWSMRRNTGRLLQLAW